MLYGITWIAVALLTIFFPILFLGGIAGLFMWTIPLITDIIRLRRIPKGEVTNRKEQKKEIRKDLIWIGGILIVMCCSWLAAEFTGLIDLLYQEIFL